MTGNMSPIFHPLLQNWNEHFVLKTNGLCHGLTPVGRVTVEVLKTNHPLPKIARSLQIRIGLLIPSES